MNVACLGAGGMIGGHLVARLLHEGHTVRAVDIKRTQVWEQFHPEAENLVLDCSDPKDAHRAVQDQGWVFNLAADMGGIGYIEGNRAACAMTVLTTANVLRACRDLGVARVFYSSSACVYPADAQTSPDVVALAEHQAIPAEPEAGYGWEKLYGELLARYFFEDYGLETRVARYHNIYATHTTWQGGREKAPAALCRKVATAVATGEHTISIWGDGEQTRSFCWIDDCIDGTLRLMASNVREPINIGSSELVTVNQLVDLLEEIAGVTLERTYDLSAPQGVRGRNSDNTLVRERLGWQPSTPLRVGLERLYRWVAEQVDNQIAGLT